MWFGTNNATIGARGVSFVAERIVVALRQGATCLAAGVQRPADVRPRPAVGERSAGDVAAAQLDRVGGRVEGRFGNAFRGPRLESWRRRGDLPALSGRGRRSRDRVAGHESPRPSVGRDRGRRAGRRVSRGARSTDRGCPRTGSRAAAGRRVLGGHRRALRPGLRRPRGRQPARPGGGSLRRRDPGHARARVRRGRPEDPLPCRRRPQPHLGADPHRRRAAARARPPPRGRLGRRDHPLRRRDRHRRHCASPGVPGRRRIDRAVRARGTSGPR